MWDNVCVFVTMKHEIGHWIYKQAKHSC